MRTSMALWRPFRGCWGRPGEGRGELPASVRPIPRAPHPASPREEVGRGVRSCGFPSPRPYGGSRGGGRGELPASVRPIPRAPHPASPREEVGRGVRSCGFPSPRPYGERPGEGRGELPAPVRPIPRAPHPASPREEAGREVPARDMREPPVDRRLSDGRRHFHDGPIDLVIEAFGEARAVEAAYAAAWRRFATVLDELCTELPLLRAPSTPTSPRPRGVVARRMTAAVAPFHAERFVTPMAAVAGAVAEEILAAMTSAARLDRAYVNNGGDIALHLEARETFTLGMVDRLDRPSLFGRATILANDSVRGIATSGWRGRSFSLGIADAVTVLASSAAGADAAATLIANAVGLPGHPAIERTPARDLDPQSDLGNRLVTTDVGWLAAGEIDRALASGAVEAELWRSLGLIEAAALRLGERTRLVGPGRRSHQFVAGSVLSRNEGKARHALG